MDFIHAYIVLHMHTSCKENIFWQAAHIAIQCGQHEKGQRLIFPFATAAENRA